jgi:hypothetical protein
VRFQNVVPSFTEHTRYEGADLRIVIDDEDGDQRELHVGLLSPLGRGPFRRAKES